MQEYFEALERLEKGKPKMVPLRTKITNDAVSLEAGNKKGSIKKSRSQFQELIAKIDEAAERQRHPEHAKAEKLNKAKQNAKYLRDQLDESRARELSLLREVHRLRCKLGELTGEKVVPIRAYMGNVKQE